MRYGRRDLIYDSLFARIMRDKNETVFMRKGFITVWLKNGVRVNLYYPDESFNRVDYVLVYDGHIEHFISLSDVVWWMVQNGAFRSAFIT